ncbi:mus308 [Drosophila busckii]|uniref:DNA polymerase theta n=1 Tax=Drosophila busckii TaxID=30019 RepID=A0A0M3QX93_DROBS|nr:DNA polymerase theta [Drosophila busckii]ALC45469.1 mus308 [Drosophila busckii]
MAFSQSFEFGDSTFMKLENDLGNKHKNEKDLDIIHESPPSEKLRTHTQAAASRSNVSRRQSFRRWKSDSKMGQSTTNASCEKYADFFKDDFSYEGKQAAADTGKADVALMRVSQIQAELDAARNMLEENSENINTTSIFEAHICTEDVFNTETEDMDDKRESPVELANLDESSFLCPVRDNVGSQQLQKDLLFSHCELAKHSQHHSESLKMSKLTQNLSSMSPNQLRLSPNSCSLNEATPPPNPEPVPTAERKSIAAWGLPPSVLNEYKKKGVLEMFDWQVECLSKPKVLFEHCNLVYSAPTSAGKTLVSEILLLKTVLERSKKVLLILPFISVVREKMFYLQDLLQPAGYRVEGFFGGYTPPGGFESINVAICTIEKANSIVNKLLEHGKLDELGIVIVDEVHLISDPGRGYILELLLAKLLYMSRKQALQIQIVTMSATLANVELLQHWLNAELYITNYRPVALQEMIKLGSNIFDNKLSLLRDLNKSCEVPTLSNDGDQVAQLCIETLLEGCSAVVFCPSKDWCENLAVQLATALHVLLKSDNPLAKRLRTQLNPTAIEDVKQQLRDIPTGLEAVLGKAITYGCAFHHAGLTTEERDIVEASFKAGALKLLVATSTLSSGVNLPARRVIIRSPLFGGKQMNSLTYRQMIGRAGRTGKDTLGESILICTESNARIGQDLITAQLQPISSCLEQDGSMHLKRALLEVISSGVVSSRQDIDNFVNCTLLSAQKSRQAQADTQAEQEDHYLSDALDFLVEYEFVRLQTDEETAREHYVATRLGTACLASSMPPTDGLILFAELQKARRCFVLESELHAVYLVTPYSVCYQLQQLDWLLYLDMWEKLNPAMKKVGELVGVKEAFLVRAMRGQTKLDYKLMQIHKRFYTALALQELVNETPINVVSHKFKCPRGMLQSLQQMASTFAGIVSAFCQSLQWSTLALIVSQFKERLYFGIQRELIDLMRLPDLSHKRARVLYDAGITSLVELAGTNALTLEQLLHNSLSFDSAKQHEHENALEAAERNSARNFFITGKAGMTAAEAAKLLIAEARQFVQHEIGVENIKWTQVEDTAVKVLHMSIEEEQPQAPTQAVKKRQISKDAEETPSKVRRIESNPKELQNILAKVNTEAKRNVEIQTPRNGLKPKELPSNLVNVNTVASHIKEIQTTDSTKPLEVQQTNVAKANMATAPLKEIVAKAKDKTICKTLEPTAAKIISTPAIAALEEKPSTSACSRKELLDKQIAERRHIALMKINSRRAKLENARQGLPTEAPAQSLPGSTPPPKTNTKENVPPNKTPIVTPTTAKSKTPTAAATKSLPRRSPRNHKSSTPALAEIAAAKEQDLFDNDESFMLNTGLTAALTAAEAKAQQASIPDEIPSSQPQESHHSPHASRLLLRSQRMQSPKTKPDEIPSSQPLESHQTPHASRLLLRSQRMQSPKTKPKTEPAPAPKTEPISDSASAGSSMELSNMSLENSLIKHPHLLNASHILSCSKLDEPASSFASLDIIDLCGNQQLFQMASAELQKSTRCGLSIAVQAQAGKRKPLIGANLLINQVAAEEQRKAAADMQPALFQLDDSCFMAGVSFCLADNVVYYLNLQQEDNDAQLSSKQKLELIAKLLSRNELTLIMHDGKEQLKTLRRILPQLSFIDCKLEDPKAANWLLQPDKTLSFHNMCQQFAPECTALLGLCGSGRGYSSYGMDASSAILPKVRASIEACVSLHILHGQLENLERIGSAELLKFFREVEMPIHLSLCHMECLGFPVKEHRLLRLYQQMLAMTKKLESKIYELHGSRFNLGSTQAVGKVLGLHRKPSGRVNTSRQILEKLDSPMSQLILNHRKLSTLLAKCVQPLLKCCQTNRVHGQSISYTATGRISMAEPNLQNIAKDFEVQVGSEKINISCRSSFAPMQEQRCLLSADFCQLEMRILAHLSMDKALLAVMNSSQDLFTAIAAHWHKIKESEVTEPVRNGTKQICYGIVYGMGMRSLAEALKCTEQEAKMLSEQFHATYPGIRAYAEKVVKFARNNGYVETITSRRRYLDHINSGELQLKNQAERQAINSTVQGSAADIAKTAILRMEKNIKRYREKIGLEEQAVNLVLHLHDELIFEVPADKARKIAKVLRVTMENCIKLNVPLRVKLKIGRSWGEMQEI